MDDFYIKSWQPYLNMKNPKFYCTVNGIETIVFPD